MIDSFDELVAIAETAKTNRLKKSEYRRVSAPIRDKTMQLGSSMGGIRGVLARSPFIRRGTHRIFVQLRYAAMCSFCDALIDDFKAFTNEYRQIYDTLSDERSQRVYINLLAGRMLLDGRYGVDFQEYKKDFAASYLVDFPEGAFIGKDEIFVDCGAFTGDTLQELIDAEKSPKEYYGFEPEKKNFVAAAQLFERSGIKGKMYNTGVYSFNGELRFTGSGMSASVSESGEQAIKVSKLDDALGGGAVTCIKMDIEGSECEALQGGAALLAKYKPKLIISIYHLPADYRTVPMLIKRLNGAYSRFYIRYLGVNYRELRGFEEVVLFAE